jgi:hypothetical protein
VPCFGFIAIVAKHHLWSRQSCSDCEDVEEFWSRAVLRLSRDQKIRPLHITLKLTVRGSCFCVELLMS